MTFGDLCFSFDGSVSLPIFYVQRKNEENLTIRNLNFFGKMHHGIPLLLAEIELGEDREK